MIETISSIPLYDWLALALAVGLLLLVAPVFDRVFPGAKDTERYDTWLHVVRAVAILFLFMAGYRVLTGLLPSELWLPKAVTCLLVIYLSYVAYVVLDYAILKRFGKQRKNGDEIVVSETYNSRLLSLLAAILLFVVALVACIQTLGFQSMLEAGGVIGFIGVFLALTQASWAPDIISGLIVLNSKLIDEGDVIQIDEGGRMVLGIVFRTRMFHTELLNLATQNRMMIKNSRIRDYDVHNLSRFSSPRGLREKLLFKIGYDVNPDAVIKMFDKAWERAIAHPEVQVNPDAPFEAAIEDTGDYAIVWAVLYFTKEVKQMLRIRQQVRDIILRTSIESGISLATPDLMVVSEPSEEAASMSMTKPRWMQRTTSDTADKAVESNGGGKAKLLPGSQEEKEDVPETPAEQEEQEEMEATEALIGDTEGSDADAASDSSAAASDEPAAK